MKYRVLFPVMALLCTATLKKAAAQTQPLYSQYMFNGSVINPAYMSMDEAYNINTVYRSQWAGIEGAPKTGTVSFTMPAFTTNNSFGVMALQDKLGVDEEMGVNLMLSQRVTLTKDTYLALGVTGGFSTYREMNSALEQSQDPVFADNKTYKRSNLGLGLMYYSDRFFVGLSSPSFKKLTLNDNQAELQSAGHYYLSTGYLFDLDDDFKFKPTALVKKVGKNAVQAELMSSILIKDVFWIGAGWRQKESYLGMMQITIHQSLQLGYSYDYAPKNLYKGSHEIAIRYRFGSKDKAMSTCYF